MFRQQQQILSANAITLCCLLSVPQLAFSAGGIDLQVPRPLIEMKQKGMVTIPFIVRNESNITQLFDENIALPQGWRLMSPSVPFRLRAGQRDTRLIHVYAPSGITSGEVSLGYEVVSRTDRSLRQSTRVRVQVRGMTSAGLKVKSLPASVIAGNAYKVVLQLSNKGNQADNFVISVKDGSYGYIDKVTPRRIKLNAGATTDLIIEGEIPANLKYSTRYPLQIRVTTKKSDIELYKDLHLSLISRKPIGIGQYHSISSKLTLRALGNQKNKTVDNDESQTKNLQLEFTGVGVLDNDAKHHIEFDVRMQKKGLEQKSTALGLEEKYKLRYWNKTLSVEVGDFSHNLGQLLGGNYGRGLGAEYKKDNWWVKATHLQAIDTISSEGSDAISVGYRFKDGFDLGVSLSQKEKKEEQYRYAGLQLEYTHPFVRITTELAKSNQANALRLDLSGHYNTLSYDLRTRQVASGFEADTVGSRQLSVSVHYPLGENLTLTLGSNYQRTNLDDDLSKEIKQHKEHYLRLGYDVWESRSGHLLLEAFRITEEDLRINPTLKTEKLGSRLEYRHQFDDWNISLRHENAETTDQLTTEIKPNKKSEFRLGYIPENEDYQLSAFVEGIETNKNEKRTNYGISGNWRFSQKMHLNGYWRRGLVDSTTVYNSDFYELKVTHAFNNGLELGLRASHDLTNKNEEKDGQEDRIKDTSWMLELSFPLDIPFRKRDNIGSASGKVISATTRKPMANAIVDMKGMYAVTDAQGKFHFPDIYAGDYAVNVDLSHLDDNNYATTSGKALTLKVSPDQESHITIPLISAASLTGVVAYQGKAEENLLGNRNGKNGLLVTLSRVGVTADKTKIYKRLTMDNGHFSFYGIPPGKWKVQVLDPENVLDRERIDNATQEINLSVGKATTLNFKIISWTKDLKNTGPASGFSVESD